MDLIKKTTLIRNIMIGVTAVMILLSIYSYITRSGKDKSNPSLNEIVKLEASGIVITNKAGLSSIRNVLDVKTTFPYADTEFLHGTISGDNIVIGVCDGNKVTAASVASILYSTFKVKDILLINTGTAITKDLPIGAVVVGNNTYQYDVGTHINAEFVWSTRSGVRFQGGRVPTDRSMRDSYLVKLSKQFDHPLITNIVTGDGIVLDPKYANNLHETFDALVADSECAAVGLVAYAFNKPFATVTIIANSAFYNDINSRNELDIATKDECVGKILMSIYGK